MNIIHDLPPSFPDNTYVAIDTEIFGMNEKQMHRPISGTFACLTVCADPETVYITQNEKDVPEVLRRLNNCIWVLQNAKFDLVQLRRWANVPPRTRLIDTMLIERILWNGYYDRFGEDALARRYLDIALDKSLQKAFSKTTEMTPEMIEYACKDPSTDLRVWKEGQKPLLTKTDMKVWREIDLPCMWAVMDFQGFRLDVDKWRALAERNKARQMELKEQLPFNPNSNPKSIEFYNKYGFKRIPNNQKETLEFFINKYPNTIAAKQAKKALDSKQYGTWASRYGMNFIDDYLEWEDDIALIHCNYWITGAETGRMSADDPAMHQIPVRETKEFRECFIARPNQKLVIVDWCSQEIGIQAFLAQDKKMMEIFNSGQDIYILMAKEMLGKTIEKSDPLRPTMKAVVLGSDYGMSEQGLAKKLDVSLDDAVDLMNQFRHTFLQMYEYMEMQSEKKKFVQTICGRKSWLNPYSDQCGRNAINSPTQGSGGDMLKKSIARMHKEWKFDYPFAIVEVTHDEAGADVPEKIAPDVQEFMANIMIETANEMCPGMSFRVDKHICNNWAEAK